MYNEYLVINNKKNSVTPIFAVMTVYLYAVIDVHLRTKALDLNSVLHIVNCNSATDQVCFFKLTLIKKLKYNYFLFIFLEYNSVS